MEFSISRPETTSDAYYYYSWRTGGFGPYFTKIEEFWRLSRFPASIIVKFFRADTNAELASFSDIKTPSATWAYTEVATGSIPYDPGTGGSRPNPTTVAATAGTVSFPASGTLSFSASAFTYKLIGLPSGYSSGYELGTVYVDANGFLKLKNQ